MIPVAFKVDEVFLEKLDAYAIRHNLNRSVVIRMALEKLLNDEKDTVLRIKVEKGKKLRR